jgi:hypothetical protein
MQSMEGTARRPHFLARLNGWGGRTEYSEWTLVTGEARQACFFMFG